MKIKAYFLFITVIIISVFFACVPNGTAPEIILSNTIDTTIVDECTTLSNTHIVGVTVPDDASAEFTIRVDAEFMDGCGFFAGRKLTKRGYHYYLDIATGHHICNICTEAIVPYTHYETLHTTNSGTYTIHVKNYDGSEVIRQVIVH